MILSSAFEMSFLMVLATPLHGAFESNHWGMAMPHWIVTSLSLEHEFANKMMNFSFIMFDMVFGD